MGQSVYVFHKIYDALTTRGIDPETLRSEFNCYKQGNEFDHPWFCHDRGANPGEDLRHVHFIPSDEAAAQQWEKDFADIHKKKRRTSDSAVLYACHPIHGFLIIDVLDDPGAHDLWTVGGQRLKSYEQDATDFCTFGLNPSLHK